MALDNGKLEPALPEGVIEFTFSPNGNYVVASSTSDPAYKIYDLSGGPPRPISKGRMRTNQFRIPLRSGGISRFLPADFLQANFCPE
jgi:hypothetical protein